MAAQKPFNAIPIKAGKRYQRKAARKQQRSAVTLLGAAALVGGVVGIGSVAVGHDGVSTAAAAIKPLAVSAGLIRARAPQEGDHWYRCDEARAAGSAPLYIGEPGYRDALDGDGDGVACEPYPGMR